MHTLTIESGFPEWREKARALLQAKVEPREVIWEEPGQSGLFAPEEHPLPSARGSAPTVPRDFLSLAETIAHHRSPERWALLYETLWRLTWGRESKLLKIASDTTIARLQRMRKEIGRDVHKMHAFVRFKKTGEDPETGREQFMAWFEPDHQIMPLTAKFFQKRFTGMDWAIFTPTGSASWDGKTLRQGPGVTKVEVPEEELDELWRGYYRSIFNPARLKVKAMQAEMPKKYWKSLPESALIESLISESRNRVGKMYEEKPRPATSGGNNPYLKKLRDLSTDEESRVLAPDEYVGQALVKLREAASCCQACPLHSAATGTVMGEGPPDAEIMIVGEQPGDQEDLLGRPFVGPAGQFLDRALEAVGIERSKSYLTNAVKHFKFVPKGKHRLHQNPNLDEISRCKPWLIGEILQVKPRILILLGSSACKSLIDPKFKITQERGLVENTGLAEIVIATVHPSYLLRLVDPQQQKQEKKRFLEDLSLARSFPPTS
ncbi:MAG: putative DNA metabolism protein [Akkermansiaceae bacterium]|jgi:probable DNA metabolism protein